MTHGSTRSYNVKFEGNNQTNLRPFVAEESFRPKIGDQIKLADFPNEIFIVTRTEPAGNPEDVALTYIVEHKSDHDKVAGGAVANFAEYFIRSQKGGTSTKIYY